MERGVHRYLHEHMGQVAPMPLHVIVNGWYFYSLNWLPAPGVALRRNLVSMARKGWENWRKLATMFPQTILYSAYQEFEDEFFNEILPQYRQAVTEAEAAVEHLTTRELMETVNDLSDLAGRYFGSIAVVAGSGYKFETQLATFWNRNLKPKLSVSHMLLLQGLDQGDWWEEAPRLASLDWSTPPLPPARLAPTSEELRKERLTTERQATEILARSPRKSDKFQRLLTAAQRNGPIREEQLGLLGLGWPVLRRSVERIGESLAESSALTNAEDVFFLNRDELDALIGDPRNMDDVVSDRRVALARAERLVPPMWVGRIPLMVTILFRMTGRVMGASRSDRAIARGVPVSPGRATGPVRIIRDPSEFAAFEEGEILVAPLTAPAWTDLFDRAAAVVTDVGSALAHASIIAREYGIPAVVGCGDATARLHDGQVVTVDGSTGIVELSARN